MKRVLLLSALAAIGVGVAFAHPPEAPRPPGPPPFLNDMDPNRDGFITREEAGAAAEKNFAALDTDKDGKLTSTDHHGRASRIMMQRHEGKGKGEAGEERRIERVIINRAGDGDGAKGEEQVIETEDGNTRVIIRTNREGGPSPRIAMTPRAPMMMMVFANNEESDLDGDGALSLAEFKAQQLRFFDAADANRDGKVKFDPPVLDIAAPPAPPTPPTPPASPKR